MGWGMKIRVKLFATFQKYLPEGSGLEGVEIDVDEGTTLKDLYRIFKLPEETPKITLVDGKHQKKDFVLTEGMTVSIFPPIAGG